MFHIPAQSHVFFDFDGTLADTDPDIRATWREVLSELGAECPSFDEIYVTGPSLNDISLKLFPSADAGLLERIRDSFKRHYDLSPLGASVPYPGVEEWLRALRAAGKTLYILSNKRMAALERLLGRYGWTPLFRKLYTADMDPENIRGKGVLFGDALRELGVDPVDAVVIGDTRGDIEAAHANTVRAIAVSWGYSEPDALSGADEILNSISR